MNIASNPQYKKISNYVHLDGIHNDGIQKNSDQRYNQSAIQKNSIVDQVSAHFQNPVAFEDNQGDLVWQNQFYKRYNDRIAKQFEDILTGNGFSVYQKDLIVKPQSNQAFEELLISSDRLSPLMKALEDENKILKEEVSHLSGDLKRFIGMVELLLEENKYLREHINQKNRDITKLIETIGLNDGEEINDLKHKIHILTEENNILIKHLDEMKRFREEYDNYVGENDIEFQRARDVIEKTKEDLDEALKREENLAKQLSLIEPKYSKQISQLASMEDKINDLESKLNHAKNDNQTLKSEYQHYKNHFEELGRKRGDENDQLLQENNMIMNEKKELKQQVGMRDRAIEELKQQLVAFRKEAETKGFDLDQLSQTVNEYQNQFQLEKQRADSSLARERQMRDQVETAKTESEKSKERCAQLEKQYNSLLESTRQDQSDRHVKYEGLVEQLKMRNREALDQKEDQISEYKTKQMEQDRQIQQLNNELDRRNADVADFKRKLAELRESRGLLDKQSAELIQLKNEHRDLNNLLNEYKNQKTSFQGGEKEYKQLLNQVRELEINISSMEKNNSLLKEENEYLKVQISDLKQETREFQEKLAGSKKEVQLLKDEKEQAIFDERKERIHQVRQPGQTQLPTRNLTNQPYINDKLG